MGSLGPRAVGTFLTSYAALAETGDVYKTEKEKDDLIVKQFWESDGRNKRVKLHRHVS